MNKWTGRLAAVAAVWAVVVVPMILLGMGPRPVLLALIAAGAAATVFCAVDVLSVTEPARWLRPMRTAPRPLEDPRANQLLRMIEAAADDPNRAAALRALLHDLEFPSGPTAPGTTTTVPQPASPVTVDERPLRLAEIDQIVRRIESHGDQ